MIEPGCGNLTVDPFTMVILRRRFEAVIQEMVNALYRSGRSGIINTAKDFSCSVTDHKLQAISTAVGLPMHVGAIELTPAAVLEKFGRAALQPGDCFASNSSYHGNTHCADFTLSAPVFVDGELAFFSIARAHFADMGFPTPTTYSPLSRDVYEEGLMLPCVRIQQDYKDQQDVIDICRANIRIPDQFYGDYLATLAAVRAGERGFKEICRKYGLPTVRAFLDQYQAYGEAMAIAAIRKLPRCRIEKEFRYDSELAAYPDGIPVRAVMEVEPDAATITIDLRQNIDNLPLGINLTEATVLACTRNGVLNVLGPEIPRCTGAFRRIRTLMREGSAIGKPAFPAATSAATTNLAMLLMPLIQSMFAEMNVGLGTACGTIGNPASCSTLNGSDSRRGGRRFANQIIMGYWAGPALYGHDGWLTYGGSGSQGVLTQASVEVVEQQQPILVERLEIRTDSGGAGQWEGAPSALTIYRTRDDAVRFTANTGGRDFPPPGVAGGGDGAANHSYVERRDGTRTELPISLDVTLQPGERLISEACGGGGYGDPLLRDPERVAERLRAGWISETRAHDTYGVVVDTLDEIFVVDVAATDALRAQLRDKRTSQGGA
jgi:N-methylhydantoinase B